MPPEIVREKPLISARSKKMKKTKQRPSAARRSKRTLLCILLAGLALFFLLGGQELFSFSQLALNYNSLKSYINGQLVTALLVFGAIYIVTIALSLPIASLLTLAGGALLGWIGAVVIICAATIGASIVFVAAQTLMSEFFTKRTTGFLGRLEVGFQKNAFFYLLALRLFPFAPFWVLNIMPALLGMRLSQYVLATFIGIIPGTLIYVWVARGFDNLLSRGQSPDLSVLREPAIIVPLFALFMLSLIPAFWRQLRAGQQPPLFDVTSDDKQDEVNNG